MNFNQYFLISIFLLLISVSTKAQVGLNTVTPTAGLEITTTNTGIPAIELEPQSAPTGTTDGQLAVIDDQLYLYDVTRGKWLSTHTEAMAFNENSPSDDQPSRFGGDLRNGDSGPVMPQDATIVYATGRAAAGNQSKTFQIRVKNGTTIVSSQNVTLSSGQFIEDDLNIDIDAGEYIEVYVTAAGAAIEEHAVLVFVKWRE